MRTLVRPPALHPGAQIYVASPASAPEPERLDRGLKELAQLGYLTARHAGPCEAAGYFSRPLEDRMDELKTALGRPEWRAIFCSRGGYGANYLLDRLDSLRCTTPKILLGYSDITSLEIFLWQKHGWVTFYGPMVAAGFEAGAGVGYDADSFARAVAETRSGWSVHLQAEALVAGDAEGVLLGGCLTLVEATLGTPWELDTDGAILVLEDRAVKAYQLDRMLMHLKQAGKFAGVQGIVLGEFPDSPPFPGAPGLREVSRRILGELGVPVVWGAPVGHTPRPMLTLPLGVRARLRAAPAELDILEPAVTA